MKAYLVCALLLLARFSSSQFAISPGYPNGGTITGAGGLSGTGTNTYGGSGEGMPAGSIAGPYNFQWYWTGSAPAPQYVILTAVPGASWRGAPNGGAASDSFGDPYVSHGNPPTSGGTGGTHTVVQTVSNGTVSYSVSASASVTNGGSFQGGATVTIAPITIALAGPIASNGSYEVAVGQYVTASLVSPVGASGDEYLWYEPGDIRSLTIRLGRTAPLRRFRIRATRPTR